MTDGEGNETQGHIGDHGKGVHLLKGVEAQTGDPEAAQHTGPDQDAGNQVGGDVRKMEFDKKTGHQKPGEQGDRNQEKGLHNRGLRFLSGFVGVRFRTGEIVALLR